MHNRVRMVVASFLTKHLRIHWRDGEAWFWDTLVDADYANNPGNWQWSAGTGADAAPYFRIFNPTTQAQKFDPDGTYIRRWVPELAALSDKSLREPWRADAAELDGAGITPGETYPQRVVEHSAARAAALAANEALR
jgi:deoxyribodipyrimidine photo-lyase